MSQSGYLGTVWPGEDGTAQRLQQAPPAATLGLRSGEKLHATSRRTWISTMTLLGAPGEVYLLTHSALRERLGLPTTACVERIHAQTLQTMARSPRLAGGPMWPGGMAIHRNADIYVVYGRYLHRLDRACQPRGQFRLPLNQPYNSFVILDNGLIVTKNLSEKSPAQLSVIDAETLQPVCADTLCPQASMARLSALGNTVYVVGVRSVFRYHWHAERRALVLDADWQLDYVGQSQQSYGWDMVLDGQNAWFMDNGKHRYVIKMIGNAVGATPNRLIRVSLRDASDHQMLDVCGLARGSITNPPLIDVQRKIVIGYDSANRHLQAWRYFEDARALTPLWHKTSFGCASHMLLYPQSGELVINDYRRGGEEVVLLAIESGRELARVRCGGRMQGVVFPSPGWDRDVYWSSMDRLTRIFVA